MLCWILRGARFTASPCTEEYKLNAKAVVFSHKNTLLSIMFQDNACFIETDSQRFQANWNQHLHQKSQPLPWTPHLKIKKKGTPKRGFAGPVLGTYYRLVLGISYRVGISSWSRKRPQNETANVALVYKFWFVAAWHLPDNVCVVLSFMSDNGTPHCRPLHATAVGFPTSFVHRHSKPAVTISLRFIASPP